MAFSVLGVVQNTLSSSSSSSSNPVAIETAATSDTGVGPRITAVTDDPRQTGFLFQRLSVALQRGNAVSFRSTFTTE